jgi:hypothetical protein
MMLSLDCVGESAFAVIGHKASCMFSLLRCTSLILILVAPVYKIDLRLFAGSC